MLSEKFYIKFKHILNIIKEYLKINFKNRFKNYKTNINLRKNFNLKINLNLKLMEIIS